MVAALAGHESVFTVLGLVARTRRPRRLAAQLAISLAASAVFAALMPQWWSVAALFLASGLHAAWGLLAQRQDRRQEPTAAMRVVTGIVAAAGTAVTIVGIVGLAVALFTGQGRSPYDPCGPGATSRYCRSLKTPTPVSHLP